MIYSRTFKPAPAMCCQACVFGQGQHEPWCEKNLDEQIRRDFSNGQITMQRLAEKYPEQLVYSGGVNQKEKEARECPRHPQSPMMLKGNQWSCVVCDAIGIAADVFRERFQCAPQWEGTAKGHPLHRK